eukprot:5693875-Pyramimonas_sp.AAC.1
MEGERSRAIGRLHQLHPPCHRADAPRSKATPTRRRAGALRMPRKRRPQEVAASRPRSGSGRIL